MTDSAVARCCPVRCTRRSATSRGNHSSSTLGRCERGVKTRGPRMRNFYIFCENYFTHRFEHEYVTPLKAACSAAMSPKAKATAAEKGKGKRRADTNETPLSTLLARCTRVALARCFPSARWRCCSQGSDIARAVLAGGAPPALQRRAGGARARPCRGAAGAGAGAGDVSRRRAQVHSPPCIAASRLLSAQEAAHRDHNIVG